jgi:preprotein translocase subunit YajC
VSPAQPSMIEMFLPFVFIFVIFYFLIIRPQGKKLKQHDKFVAELKRGDEIITNAGFFGRIDSIAELFVVVEIANGVKVKMLKKQIAGSQASLVSEGSNKKSADKANEKSN